MYSKKLLLILFFAFIIRLIFLNQSLWLDETTTAKVVQQYNYIEILTKFSPQDFHPPFYYLLMKSWTDIFGYSEVALRFPSIIFSLSTGYFVYKIAKLLNGYIAGVFAAVFFLFNPLIVYYSQEARMYLLATFFLTGALYYFLKLTKNKKDEFNTKEIIFFNLFILLSLLTFYGSAFLILAFLVYFLYKKLYRHLFFSLLTIFGYSILISPLLYNQLVNAKVNLSTVTSWSLVLGRANLKNLLLIPIKFLIGRIDFYPKWLYYGIAGLWTGFVLFETLKIKNSLKTENFKLKIILVYLLIFPLVLGFVISFITPLLQYFRFIYLIPIMSILLSFSLSGKATYNRFGCTALFLGFLIFSFVYLLFPQFHREDWKSLVKSLPIDKPIYMILSSSDPVRYYNSKLIIKDLKNINDEQLGNKIIVIPYTADIHGIDYINDLSDKGYRLENKKSFRDLQLEEYIKK